MDLDAAAALARRLMEENGLQGWALAFDNAKTRAGVCRFDRKQIGLSRLLTRHHSEAEVRDTILHEIAHALVGPDHGHGDAWRQKAREIGGSGERCVSSRAGDLPGDWVGACPSGHTVERHRRPERVLTCALCRPFFDIRFVYDWSFRGRPAQMHPVYQAELALLQGRAVAPGPREGELTLRGAVIPRQSVSPVLPVGTPVIIEGAGPLAGRTGRVFKRGRTRYQVLTDQGVISIDAPSVRQR